ncbi:MAG: patatin-like phospholipase family protein [Chloroflexi bacterium]|nr:patatin-like phospholipase family protein [Chloroflexota bacterium]
MLEDILKFLTDRTGLSRSHFRNLVFKGGGVRGIAYMGALELLEAEGILRNIERVAGTSAGAIAAALVSFRRPVDDTIRMFDSLDLNKIPQNGSEAHIGGLKFLPLKNTESYRRIFERYGWYSSDYFYQWLEEVIAGQCGGDRRATFNDFRRRGFRDLHIVASNLSRRRAEDFSYATTPNVAVADAVRMSMSIPLYFEALRFDGQNFGQGDYYVDGGLFNNYPIHLFDQDSYVHNKRFFRGGVNWETLGLFLIPDALECEVEPEYPDSIWEFLSLTIQSIYDSHQMSNIGQNLVDKQRTILINDCGISSVKFDVEPLGEEYQKLFVSGKQAVQNFLKK